ncbi:Leu/Phe/Val dehydrogenase [Paenibacillus sacheonensis]|uniref:Amino acid dehydrogenase n=1 Tax=Paenibacillus sacheonensis TaxID=742054 RepID=A0A7X4YSK8_9BACL|nr:Glu/Leu/Phe/Val dehydrogenase [Paenibacillus sacheonensis]MBM7568205.1 leucine dehydrogenase [Paenibacillus sacheonensis]NBC71797.1 amino acid dehydrogenase [Paenibacillus sacheonensis]
MDVWKEMKRLQVEQVVFCQEERSGLQAVIAIHSTKMGPALGGCRMWVYDSENDAVADAVRLARGMTYKAAFFGLPYGGGKAVIVGNPSTDKSEAKFRALGRFIDRLQGRYLSGVDLGTTVRDMDWIRLETAHVTDTTGTLMATGDFTAEMTAYGVFLGMKASADYLLGSGDLSGRTVAVQGLGKVGFLLCGLLRDAGASLIVTDIDQLLVDRAVKSCHARAVATDAIYGESCDIFAPCALGGILNDDTIPKLRCAIVAGSANNQLLEEARHGEELEQRGILYAPDFVINAGGLIITAGELQGQSVQELKRGVERIYGMLLAVYRRARAETVPTGQAAKLMAEEKLAAP